MPMVVDTCSISAARNSSIGAWPGSQGDETDDGLALDLIRPRNHCRFRHRRVAHQRAFDFHRAEAVAGDLNDVVHAAQHPDVAVFVALGGVAGEIDAGNLAPVFAL